MPLIAWTDHCKRCYFRVTKFSRLAAQKHIRGLLNSRWADAHLSFWYCTMLTSFNEWYIYIYVCIKLGSTKTKQVSDRLEYITNLHQHIWLIHNSYVSKMCIPIFCAGFWIRASWICAKYTKINVPQIFPLLQIVRSIQQAVCNIIRTHCRCMTNPVFKISVTFLLRLSCITNKS